MGSEMCIRDSFRPAFSRVEVAPCWLKPVTAGTLTIFTVLDGVGAGEGCEDELKILCNPNPSRASSTTTTIVTMITGHVYDAALQAPGDFQR